MTNNRLVTEVRINKHGVPVKRHVLPDDGNKAASVSLPQPRFNSAAREKTLRAALVNDIDYSMKPDGYVKQLNKVVDELPMSMVLAAQEQIDRHPDSRRVGGAVESAIVSWDQEYEADGLRRIAFTELERLYDKHWKKSPLGNPYQCFSIVDSAVAALNPNGEYDNSLESTPDSDRDVLALGYCIAASDLYMRNSDERFTSYHHSSCLTDYPVLAQVFLEYHDRAEELAEYVIKNGRDADKARQHMRGQPQVFADGVL
jgi:hypothetical protein